MMAATSTTIIVMHSLGSSDSIRLHEQSRTMGAILVSLNEGNPTPP